jgi:hypothetical protein
MDMETYDYSGSCQTTSSSTGCNATSSECSLEYDNEVSNEYCTHDDGSWSSSSSYYVDYDYITTKCKGKSTSAEQECEDCTWGPNADGNWAEICESVDDSDSVDSVGGEGEVDQQNSTSEAPPNEPVAENSPCEDAEPAMNMTNLDV